MVTRSSDLERPAVVFNTSRKTARAAGRPGERILYIVSSFPCLSETFIVREIHALLRRGVDVRIFALRRSREDLVQTDAQELVERVLYPQSGYRNVIRLVKRLFLQPAVTLEQPGLIVRRLWRQPYVMLKSLVAWFRVLGVMDRIEAFAPDHVHAHWATYPSTAAMTVSRHTGRPFSLTAHAHDIFVNDQLMQEKLASASFIATISRFNREYLRRCYPAAKDARIEIVHCGVPSRAHRKRAAGHGEPLILSVGRLDEVKGFPSLLQACHELKVQGVAFRCQIIGDGPLRGTLRDDVKRLDLQEHVEMLGALPSQDVEERLARADVFVLASQRSRQGNMDGIPVALMEAMAAGTPVVSTAVSGIPELVKDGETGLLVPPRDPLALAGAIERMLGDPTLRTHCIDGARKLVQREFNAETEGERLIDIIRSQAGELHVATIIDHH